MATVTTAPVKAGVIVRAPAAVVYAALTDAYLLRQWFPTRAVTDPRPGGTWSYVWKNRGGAGGDANGGRYLKLVPGRLVSYTWKAYPGHTTVTFTLTGRGARTRVAFSHAGWRADAKAQQQRRMVSGGWPFFLKNLKSWLERGVDGRPKWGMKVER